MKNNNINLIISFLFVFTKTAWSNCKLKVSEDFGISAPLLLNINGRSFIYPMSQNHKEISINTNSKAIALCPASAIEVQSSSLNREGVILSCMQNSKFLVSTGVQDFKNIRCSKPPSSIARDIGSCSNGRLIEIGFQTFQTSFIPTIKLCYNRNEARTYWAHSIIPAAIMNSELKTRINEFSEAEVSRDIPVNIAYDAQEQRKMLRRIMYGDQSLVEKWMPRTGSRHLGRGHLVPRGDQFYIAQQISTYYYINVVPMWHCINNGNWWLVEKYVKELTSRFGDLHVYTGGLYNLQLAYNSTENRDIYLAKNTVTGDPALFVPKLLFKVVISYNERKAIVFITINNPHLTPEDFPDDYKICPEYEPCKNLNRHYSKFLRGYTYCCLYNDFLRDNFAKTMGLPILPEIDSLI